MREYEVIRKSDNEIVDIIFGYDQTDAFARSIYNFENYKLVGGWRAD